MKKRKILGVRCDVIGEGMIPAEVVVNIYGNKSDAERSLGIKGYSVLKEAVEKTKRGISYISARVFNKIGDSYLCWISADGSIQKVRVPESQLVFV